MSKFIGNLETVHWDKIDLKFTQETTLPHFILYIPFEIFYIALKFKVYSACAKLVDRTFVIYIPPF